MLATMDAMNWITIATALTGLFGSVLTNIITRREFEAKCTEIIRRLDTLDETDKDIFKKLGGTERGWRDNDEKVRADADKKVSDLHEKVNRVDKAVGAIEVETRIQSNTLRAIAAKLNVTV